MHDPRSVRDVNDRLRRAPHDRLFLAFLSVLGIRWVMDIGLPLINYSTALSDPTTGAAASSDPAWWAFLSSVFFLTVLLGIGLMLLVPASSRSWTSGSDDVNAACDRVLRTLTLVAAGALGTRVVLLLTSGVGLEALAQRAVFTDASLFENPWLNLLGIIGDWATPLAVAMLVSGTQFRYVAYSTVMLVVFVGIITGGRGMALTPLVMWAVLSVISGRLSLGRRMGTAILAAAIATVALMQIASTRFSSDLAHVVQRTLMRPKRIDDLAFASHLRGAGIEIDLQEAVTASLASGLPVGLVEGSRSLLAQVADQLPNVAIRTAGNSGTTLSGAAEGYLLGGVVGTITVGFLLGLMAGSLARASRHLPDPVRQFVVVSLLILVFGASGSRTLSTMALVIISVLVPVGILRMLLFERLDNRPGRFLNVAAVISIACGLALFMLTNSKLAEAGPLETLSKLLVAGGVSVPVLLGVLWLLGNPRGSTYTTRSIAVRHTRGPSQPAGTRAGLVHSTSERSDSS